VWNDCRPCCSCDDFVRTYRGLKRLWDRWKAIAGRAEAARDTFASNRDRWLAQRECRLNHPLRLVAAGEPKCRGFFGGLLCNTTACCVPNVELRFTFQLYDGGVEADWGDAAVVAAFVAASSTQGEEAYTPQALGPVYRFLADYADPQTTVLAKLRLCRPCADGQSVKVTLTAHAPAPPPNQAGEECTLPSAEVGDDVRTLWDAQGLGDAGGIVATAERLVPLTPQEPGRECGCDEGG
jgi:hypothetical protein